MNRTYSISVLIALLLLNSASNSDVIHLRQISDGFLKEALTKQIKGLSLEDIPKSDKCTEHLYTIISNLGSKDPATFYHSFEGERKV